MTSRPSLRRSPILLGLAISILSCSAVLAARSMGVFQALELRVYDSLLHVQPQLDERDPRIVLVTVSDRDIQQLQRWPIPDETLARLLTILLKGEPRVVGLDLYRDLPVPPGEEELRAVFSQSPPIVTVMKFGDAASPGVPKAYVLTESNPVGFTDLIVDPGGIVRRGAFFLDDGTTLSTSFSLLLASLFLRKEGVFPQSDPANPSFMKLGDVTFIPLQSNDGGYSGIDSRGYQFLLNYASARVSFQSFSLTEVLEHTVDPGLFHDKIVLIGSVAESARDFFFVPFSPHSGAREAIPGIEVHGSIVSQLLGCGLDGRKPMEFLSEFNESLWILLWSLIGLGVGIVFRHFGGLLLCGFLAPVALGLATYALFVRGIWVPLASPVVAFLGTTGLMVCYLSHRERREKAQMLNLFARHVSKEVARELWEKREQFLEAGRPKPQKLFATVLFTDLQDYTTLSENRDPKELLDWLNEYMDSMSRVVMKHGGIINKYIGDAIMSLFGVPIARSPDQQAEDARMAVACALEMSREMTRLNRRWKETDRPTAKMRIGIYTGLLAGGCLGSQERLEYTVIGDTVNTASRLESFDKNFDKDNPCRILIGDETRKHLGDLYPIRKVGTEELKGRERPVTIFQVFSPENPGGSDGSASA